MTQQHYVPAPGQQYVPEPKNGLGIAAFIFGIVGVLFGVIPFTGFIAFLAGATGLILGLSNIGRLKRGSATNKIMTAVGTAISGAAMLLGIVGMVIFFAAMNQLDKDLEQLGSGSLSALGL